jgi:putative sterol carrier protein
MAVKFLSDEWAQEVTQLLQADEGVQKAAKGQNVTIQQNVTDAEDGETSSNYLRVSEGVPEVVIGTADKAEITVTENYETAVALDKGELNPQAAFMQGKIKVQGNLLKLMQLQGLLSAVFKAVKDLEREY